MALCLRELQLVLSTSTSLWARPTNYSLTFVEMGTSLMKLTKSKSKKGATQSLWWSPITLLSLPRLRLDILSMSSPISTTTPDSPPRSKAERCLEYPPVIVQVTNSAILKYRSNVLINWDYKMGMRFFLTHQLISTNAWEKQSSCGVRPHPFNQPYTPCCKPQCTTLEKRHGDPMFLWNTQFLDWNCIYKISV